MSSGQLVEVSSRNMKRDGRSRCLQAQPAQRRNTTRTLLPPPNTSFPSLSCGAESPIRGTAATSTGGGGGASHGCIVSGSDLTDIQPVQLLLLSSSSMSGRGEGGALRSLLGTRAGSLEEKSKVLLERPTLLSAIFVARSPNIVGTASSQREQARACDSRRHGQGAVHAMLCQARSFVISCAMSRSRGTNVALSGIGNPHPRTPEFPGALDQGASTPAQLRRWWVAKKQSCDWTVIYGSKQYLFPYIKSS